VVLAFRVLAFRVLAFVVFCAGLLHASPAAALDPARSIAQYKHTRWTTEDGAPGNIRALAQGPDGYLWMGGLDGLIRFDGISFETIPPERRIRDRSAVTALLVARDGSIWAGYEAGGVARFRGGALRDAEMPNPTAFVMKMVEAADGVIWVLVGRNDFSLVRFSDGAWEEVGQDWGVPSEIPSDLLAARDGTLWLSTAHAVLFLTKGGKHFQRARAVPIGVSALSQDAAGQIWLSDDAGSRTIAQVSKQFVYTTPPAQRRPHTFFDRDGNLWGSTGNAGIFRVRPSQSPEAAPADITARIDLFRERDTLTSDNVNAMMEDREGNIWISTVLGLDRFRPASVVTEPLLTKVPLWGEVLLGADDGTVFIGGADGVYRVPAGGRPVQVLAGAGEAEAMCEAPDRTVWMVMHDRIVRYRDGRSASLAKPATRQAIIDCAVDRQGVLWLSEGHGLLGRVGEGWEALAFPDHPDNGGARPLIRCRDGSLLAYLSASELRRIDFPRVRDIVLPQKDSIRQLRTIYEGMDAVLLGGNFGLARWQDNRETVIDPGRVPAFAFLTGVVQTPAGQTWLIGRRGIIEVSTAALTDAFDDPRKPIQPSILDYRDGLRAMNHRDGKRDVVRGGDGRLWFATVNGAVWVDPAHLVRNALPPAVAISALKANGMTFRDPVSIILAAGTSTSEIDFAALSLTIPDRVTVRYRLEGADQDWIDPGMRRQAFYTNLGPGRYRFQVIAANNDGVWNRQGATLAFTIPPTFLQSNGFYGLCVAATGGLLWLAYSARTRQLTARVRIRLEVQLAERERIARELHDTLLQGFHGLVLRFQSVANRIPAGEPVRGSIDQALERAEAVLVEGRNRVSELRSLRESADMAQALAAIAADLAGDWPARFSLTVEGRVRDLDPLVRVEVLRIGEEAIGNAFRHANATSICAVLIYGHGELQLGIRDDGVGLPDDVVTAGKRIGHFGLIGMRERAERAGGALIVTSRHGSGTEVRVVVPGGVAYSPSASWTLGRRITAWLPRGD
jgi:signal transduction histidine kinase/ligand-binding sensor domain-containing protein